MPKRLAVQCSNDVVRVVMAEVASAGRSGGDCQIISAIARSVDSQANAAEVLADLVKEHQWSNVHASLVIGRSHVEVRNLELPPVPDDELPDMVRLQAVRSFAASGERATIDFVPISRTEEGIKVLAASADAKTIAQMCGAAATAGLQVDRVSLQAMASASLYRTIVTAHSEMKLDDATIVSLIDGQAEIGVIRQSSLASIRTVRVPDGATAAASIGSEIKRSRLACGCTADCPVLFLGREDDPLAAAIEQQGLSVLAVDPMTIHGQTAVKDFEPINPAAFGNGFAALIGLIDAESRLVDGHDDWNVNFLSPRKKLEVKPNRTAPILIAAVAAGLLVLLGLGARQMLSAKDRQIAEVQSQIDSMADAVNDAEVATSEAAQIEKFLDADVVWIDELRRLARLAPSSSKLILGDLRGSAEVARGGGQIEIKGRVVQPSVLSEMANSAGDDGYHVIGDGASEIKTKDAYRWGFNQKIVIDPEVVREARLNVGGESDPSDVSADSPDQNSTEEQS